MATGTDFLIGTTAGRAPISPKPGKIMDLSPSHGLATGLKRVGGRKGTTRLGRTNRTMLSNVRRGRPVIAHKF